MGRRLVRLRTNRNRPREGGRNAGCQRNTHSAQAIVDDYDLGSPIEEIHENFPLLPVDTIKSDRLRPQPPDCAVRVLLDENMPHKLRRHLAKHETVTAVYAGFGGRRNGALLSAAEAAGFDVVVTGDLSLQYQQNLSSRKLAIVFAQRD